MLSKSQYKLLETGVSRDEPLQFVKKTGEVIDVLLTATAERNDKGEIVRSSCSIDRHYRTKKNRDRVRESEQRYRLLFDNMLEGCAYCKMIFEDGHPQDFIYLDVNDAFERLTGLKNVIGKKVTEVIPSIRESNPELFEVYGRVARTGNPEKLETCVESLGILVFYSVYSTEQTILLLCLTISPSASGHKRPIPKPSVTGRMLLILSRI